MDATATLEQQIEDLHRIACINRETSYKDPATGYSVLTAHFLKERRVCCGNRCRHCPYGHANVKDEDKRQNRIQNPVIMDAPDSDQDPLFCRYDAQQMENSEAEGFTVLFWSGGKDSLLTLYELSTNNVDQHDIVLLTTFDPVTNIVPFQNVSLTNVIGQAKALNLPICLVPLVSQSNYNQTVKSALKEIPQIMKRKSNVTTLAFGDIHLEDIRRWREDAFSEYKLLFPLFGRDEKADLVPQLFSVCEQFNVDITFCAIENEEIKHLLSKHYNWDVINSLPSNVDSMGENGEFHTLVTFK
jgi:ATP-binding cassette subfamily B (MDR/TAP) protein 1